MNLILKTLMCNSKHANTFQNYFNMNHTIYLRKTTLNCESDTLALIKKKISHKRKYNTFC